MPANEDRILAILVRDSSGELAPSSSIKLSESEKITLLEFSSGFVVVVGDIVNGDEETISKVVSSFNSDGTA